MAKAEDPSLLGFAKYVIRGGKLADDAQPKPKATPAPKPEDAPVGSGMVKSAADAIKQRKQQNEEAAGYKRGGRVSASRGDGCAKRGKTKGKLL